VFETYATNDLIHMVDCRIGRTIVDPKVVEFFAKRVAATSGDARKLLDLIAKAVSKCKEQLPCYRLESSEEAGIVVKMPDAMTALRESVNPKYTTLIKGLPSTRRAVLCVAVTSARSRRKESNQLTLGELRRYCVDAFGEDIELDADGFKDAIEALSDTGLLLLAKPDKKRFLVEPVSGLSMVPIRLELQLEDVENAVESELLDTGFYHRLVRSLL
jgi:Cdc6-like AAA superfamily ATPase